jgi:hypothetical protein
MVVGRGIDTANHRLNWAAQHRTKGQTSPTAALVRGRPQVESGPVGPTLLTSWCIIVTIR